MASEPDGRAIEGRYFPPASSAGRPARLVPGGRGGARLVVGEAELELVLWPETVTVSDPVGDIPRRVTLPDGATFVSPDNDAIDRWLGAAGHRVSVLARLEAFRPRLVAVALVLAAAVAAGALWGVPLLAEAAAWATPRPVLRQIGTATLTLYDGRLLHPSELGPERQGEVRTAFDRLVQATDGLAGVAVLHFRASPIGANAFALPGAQIVATDDLVRLLGTAGSAAVLAHELGHAEFRHPTRGIYQAAGLSLLLLVVAGDTSGLIEEAASLGLVALRQGYSRDFERAADTRGVALLAAAGFPPGTLRQALQRLARACGAACDESGWLSSHPAMSERLARLPEGGGG